MFLDLRWNFAKECRKQLRFEIFVISGSVLNVLTFADWPKSSDGINNKSLEAF
jgi:hypothetical protein